MLITTLLSIVAISMVALESSAQTYPLGPLNVVVTLSPGSTSDVLARVVNEQLYRSLGQSFIVENRPGAGGSIAGEAVVHSAPDGYTLLLATISSHGINPALYAKMPYDVLQDFVSIINLASSPNVLIIGSYVHVGSVKKLISYIKSKPLDTVNFSYCGISMSMNLGGELFNALTGAKTVHIPYTGLPEAVTPVMKGEVATMFQNAPNVTPLKKNAASSKCSRSPPLRAACP